MNRRSRRRSLPTLLASTVALLTAGAPGADAVLVDEPSLRIFAIRSEITVRKSGDRVNFRRLPAWIAPTGGAFELRVTRANYRSPLEVAQVDAETGNVLRELPADVLNGWRGLAEFLRVVVHDEEGERVFAGTTGFCLNRWDRQRVNDQGPAEPRYPPFCSDHPFTKGMVWGVDEGWAVSASGGGSADLSLGEYSVRMSIAKRFRDLLEIPAEDGYVLFDMTVRKARRGGGGVFPEARPQGSDQARSGAVPDQTDPDPSTLPDLLPVPAWSIRTEARGDRDVLVFGATEWNAGPAPLVVEGFRREGDPLMDAYQYFYDGETAVGRANVGTLEFHDGRGHHHWHFEEFTEYTLLDASLEEAVPSGKQSWCLVPTDAIDLTVPGAEWNPDRIGLGSACGGRDSLWVRENLDVGWGDTYFQYSAGQAFNITDVPNGRYFIQTEVNPTGLLYETDTSNNISLRRIWLGGTPGNRVVHVPPYQGIDTG